MRLILIRVKTDQPRMSRIRQKKPDQKNLLLDLSDPAVFA